MSPYLVMWAYCLWGWLESEAVPLSSAIIWTVITLPIRRALVHHGGRLGHE